MTPGLLLAAQLTAAAGIDQAINDAIRRGVFPAAVVVVGTADRVLHARGYGHLTWDASAPQPDVDSTLFDLASLTKVVATTPAVMHLVDGDMLALDRPVQEYLPAFSGPGKERVTVRHLLEHRSGMRAFLRLDTLAATAEEARRIVLEEPLRWAPGSRVEYSDLNAMLLGWVVERVAGQSLDAVAGVVHRHLGMTQTMFNPPRSLRHRVAPVGVWRGHSVAGRVHDQNAARLGGISGHAGLYSTGADLALLAQALLRGGRTASGQPVFSEETVRQFTRRAVENRALGWEANDTASAENTGGVLSAVAYGHGGFTGTSLWIDPELDLFIVVLTNRVYAPRVRSSITALKAVRGSVADAAVALRRELCAVPATARAGARCD